MKNLLIVLVVVIVLASIGGCNIYNRIVQLDEGIDNAWAQVDTVLQRRYDLIPNLVETVKGYAKHEKELLEEITQLRSQWAEAKGTDEKALTATQMEGALGRLMMVVENYPDLKANQNFLALQDELAGTENRISVERRRYNDAVRDYNTAVRRFPGNLLARQFGFQKRDAYFEAAEAATLAPKVQF